MLNATTKSIRVKAPFTFSDPNSKSCPGIQDIAIAPKERSTSVSRLIDVIFHHFRDAERLSPSFASTCRTIDRRNGVSVVIGVERS
jgi:hypothetical protein